MEEKTGRPIRPDNCRSLKRKKEIVTEHPNSHITKPNKTKQKTVLERKKLFII